MKPKSALGRGLDALLGESGGAVRRVLEVDIHRLKPNPKQPREKFDRHALEELSRSIVERGILQPILVRPADGSYEIIAGERRWRAAQEAGLHSVPVLVHEVGDGQMIEMALIENIQRQDLNPAEEARAYRVLVEDLEQTQEEVAKRVGKERATVANTLRLLQLQPEALAALEGGRITAGHAKAILSLKKKEAQGALLKAILARGLSVRQAEGYKAAPRPLPRRPDPDTAEASTEMAKKTGLRVEIRRRGAGGQVVFHFSGEEELNRIFELIVGK